MLDNIRNKKLSNDDLEEQFHKLDDTSTSSCLTEDSYSNKTTALNDDDDDRGAAGGSKCVTFDMRRNTMHDSIIELSFEEIEFLWYTEEEYQTFRETTWSLAYQLSCLDETTMAEESYIRVVERLHKLCNKGQQSLVSSMFGNVEDDFDIDDDCDNDFDNYDDDDVDDDNINNNNNNEDAARDLPPLTEMERLHMSRCAEAASGCYGLEKWLIQGLETETSIRREVLFDTMLDFQDDDDLICTIDDRDDCISRMSERISRPSRKFARCLAEAHATAIRTEYDFYE